MRAFEVATLSALRRAVRNGSVWITHSAAFGNRDQLFIPAAHWKTASRRHYARLGLPAKAPEFLEPLLNRIRSGLEAVAGAARAGTLNIDDELHLNALAAEEEDPQAPRLPGPRPVASLPGSPRLATGLGLPGPGEARYFFIRLASKNKIVCVCTLWMI